MPESDRSSGSVRAYNRLRSLITDGRLPAGERLTEHRAARLAGVGRGPARESLLRLEAEGLLRKRGSRRSRVIVYVEDENPFDLLMRYELREQVEGGAARLAAKNLNGWQIDHLREVAARIASFTAPRDAQSRYELSLHWHWYLVSHCGNPLFLKAWETYGLAPGRPHTFQFEQRVLAQIPAEQRERPGLLDVVAAMAAHDPDKAEALTKLRIRRITAALRKSLGPPVPPSSPAIAAQGGFLR